MPENPYKFKGPLDPTGDKPVCVPRDEDVQRVTAGIDSGDYLTIIGSYGIGKTTFLRQIVQAAGMHYYLYLNFGIIPQNKDELYRWIIHQFIENIPHDSVHKMRLKGKNGKESSISTELKFFQFLETFRPKEKERRIILLCEEIIETPALKSFLHIWRRIFHERHNKKILDKYGIIIAGDIDLVELTISAGGSPYNIAELLYLSDFSYEESSRLIDEPFKTLNIVIAEKAKQMLIDAVGGHPQMLQQSCHFLVEKVIKTGKPLAENEVEAALHYLLTSNELLDMLRNELTKDRILRDLIDDLLAGKKKEFYPFKKYSISGSGPIIQGPGSFCAIRNEVFKRFLTELLPQVKKTLDYKKRAAEEKAAMAQRLPLIKKESENRCDFHPGEPVPCAVKQIKIRHYHDIIKTDILLPADARWIFLTGENAYGKTVILRALAIGLFGPIDEDKILLDLKGKCKIDVEIYANGGSLINRVGAPAFKPFTRFAAYGPSRLQIQSDRTQNEITGRSTKTYSLFNDDGVSLNIERELVLWYLDNDKKYEIVREILLGLMPHGADIMVNRADKEVLYIEKESVEDGGASFKPVRSRELAAGNKSIVSMIGDMVIRFYKEYESIAPGLHPKDFEGIVIIDELDLHLHPKWLRRLPGILSKVFPKIQFIASTHSEISLLGAPRESVFLKVNRTQKQGIQIQRLPIAIENLLSHHLLTSPIFDMEAESIQAGNDNLSHVRTEDNFKKIGEINKIKKELKTITPKEKDRLKSLLEDAG